MDYKIKNILLGIVFVLLVAVFSNLFLGRVMQQSTELKTLTSHLQALATMKQQVLTYSQTNERLNKDLNLISSEEKYSKEDLFSNINALSVSHNLQIVSFQPPHIYSANQKEELLSYFITIRGDFKDMIRFLYLIESSYSFLFIQKVEIHKKVDYKSKQSFLDMLLVVQQYHKK